MSAPKDHKRRNGRVAVVLVGVAAGMVGLSFAAVPLYRLFCQVTGFGGTTQVAAAPSAPVADRYVTVRFNADVAPDLPWRFEPMQKAVRVRFGEVALARFVAVNLSDRPITGSAVFNVTPFKTGPYFSKVQCFCFDEQTLAPGERAEMPVSFFVDPEMIDDPNVREVKTITLSYTFFRAKDDEAEAPDRVAAASTASGG